MRTPILFFTICFLISLIACSTVELPNSRWNNIVYEGLDQELRSLELPETIDCGFYSLISLTPKLRNQIVGKQFDCAKRTMAMGKPFKFGHAWIPVDSTLTEIVIAQKERFLVRRIDVMLDGSEAQQETLLCDEVRFNRDSMAIEHDGCTTAANKI